jgi:hypothetical protein
MGMGSDHRNAPSRPGTGPSGQRRPARGGTSCAAPIFWIVDLGLEMLPFLLTAPSDPQKRAPHDRLSGTVVIRKRTGRGRFWEGGWGHWLAEHHDGRPFVVRHAEATGRQIVFLAGTNRRLWTTLAMVVVVFVTPLTIGLLDGADPSRFRDERVVLGLASLGAMSSFFIFLRYRLEHPMFVTASPGRHRLAGRLRTALAAVATAASVLFASHSWWPAF